MRLLKTFLNEATSDLKKAAEVLSAPMMLFFYGIVLWCIGLFGVIIVSIDYIGVGPQHVLPPIAAYVVITATTGWLIRVVQRARKRIKKENEDTIDILSRSTTPGYKRYY